LAVFFFFFFNHYREYTS